MELIIVIIIIGILAAVGISQYSLTVEKARTAEAKVRIGVMRKLAYEYYLENGTFVGVTNEYLGATACDSSNFYNYWSPGMGATYGYIASARCDSGGKTPNSRKYTLMLKFCPTCSTTDTWYCWYGEDGTDTCFGLPGRPW
ncbi:hypothetical protein EPN54_04505 [bacterium]|nr:MAG: hypothetical protein EPN54_04505 [bacterium]